MKQLSIYLLILFISGITKLALATPLTLNENSFQSILKEHRNDDFFVLIWSLDCPPCLEEMPTISTIHQQNPELKIIMISADDASRHNEVQQVIANYKLSNLQHWVFEDSENMAIRYSIDRSWYGELPRSYLFQKGQRIQSYSGQLEMPHFKDWLSQINTK